VRCVQIAVKLAWGKPLATVEISLAEVESHAQSVQCSA
jgi:hypothetical protein